jgi:Protein of unknown function (DUF1592)/Protein of unknown function (DUF1588)/Protein of unknown function (DUF1587)/Protein of unknown function (DUF1585)/Protein of unknown function (DUF1595)/Planctomycete cytochrome C
MRMKRAGWITRSWLAGGLALAVLSPRAAAGDAPVAERFEKDVQPLVTKYCYDCHADGANKGNVALDAAKPGDRDLWWRVLKNTRAGLMPPARKPRPTDDERRVLERWVKADAFGIDPADPDPGRVTVRRLNRVEYRNTVRDLVGVDFKADEEFPPDDTGYGFDTIGDVLSVSPLLLEKYMDAAKVIAAGIPRVAKGPREQTVLGTEFRRADGGPGTGDRFTFFKEAKFARTVTADLAGDYRVTPELIVAGGFNFSKARCRVVIRIDGKEVAQPEFGWQNGKRHSFPLDLAWQPGEHTIEFELQPLIPEGLRPPTGDLDRIDMRIALVKVQGPLDPKHWVLTKHYDKVFTREAAPADPAERRRYAREVLARFAKRAFRRPADDRTVDRLTAIAEGEYSRPGKTFEDGIAQAVVAVLASPRFLFRVEGVQPAAAGHPFVDEYALATRLSYFLWSTMPDDELFVLADRGELRQNLAAQVKRMLADPRSGELVRNFTGQWLQARDVDGVPINARAVLRREGVGGFTRIELDGELRRAMKQETELYFAGIVHEDRSVLDLIDSDYTYLNEKLARHYGIPGVTGPEMRKVTLPPDHSRGGVLTQGTVLTVTSNPTRTSPVKRGLFILDNILGTPPPPPPGDVPLLEDAEKEFKDRSPTMREVMEIHRQKPLCSACHARMDPLGLALENFNALGMWREKERGQAIDAAGKLITGEAFDGVRELKRILKTDRRTDFYRCLTEKLLVYALGRGLEYNDVEAVDRIVARLEQERGRFSALLTGVIESAPFQKRRATPAVTTK